MSIKLPDKLRLQICSLLCVSLAEVQGNLLIFMEIKDNIHQLSFTSFIFISFLILTLSTHPLSARLGEVFWTAETSGSLRSLLWELYQTHTHSELVGQANFFWPARSWAEFPAGFSHFSWRREVRFLPSALPAAEHLSHTNSEPNSFTPLQPENERGK